MPVPAIDEATVKPIPPADGSFVVQHSMQLYEAMTQGQVAYFDESLGKLRLAQADDPTTANGKYLIMQPGDADSSVAVARSGDLVYLGSAVLTVGVAYYVDDTTAGDMVLWADIASSAEIAIVGVAVTTSILAFLPHYEGYTK